MKKASLVGGILLAGTALLASVSPAKAVDGSLTASEVFPGTIEEDLTITLSSYSSYWETVDFHAHQNGTTVNYDLYGGEVEWQGPGSHTAGAYVPQGDAAPSGTYNCWAVAHGFTITPPSSGTNWDSGANSVTVTVNN